MLAQVGGGLVRVPSKYESQDLCHILGLTSRWRHVMDLRGDLRNAFVVRVGGNEQ
jgi:hypothetical protein